MVIGRTAWAAAVLGLAAALAAPGCSKEEAEAPTAPEKQGEAVAILRKFPASSNGGIRQEMQAILREPLGWNGVWARGSAHLAPLPKAPTVDFEKEMVAVAALGQKPTPGWSVEIVGAREVEGKLRILYAVRAPGPAEAATKQATHPWHAVVLAKSALPVEWVLYKAPKAPVK